MSKKRRHINKQFDMKTVSTNIQNTRISSEDSNYYPKISVVIPCYNYAKFLPDAVSSICRQTYPNWECLIINDGSPDDTSNVARDIITKYSSYDIKLIEQLNMGQAAARNTGISNSVGDWILPLDADDYFANDLLESSVSLMSSNPEINLISTNLTKFGAETGEWIPNDYSKERILLEDTMPYSSLFMKKLWDQTPYGYTPTIPYGSEDWSFWISCSEIGLTAYRISSSKLNYRIHVAGSMYTSLLKNKDLSVATLHTWHPNSYSRQQLLIDHYAISMMKQDLLDRTNKLIKSSPDLPMPFFWHGLCMEKIGKYYDAIADYQKAAALSKCKDWQPYYRLAEVAERIGDRTIFNLATEYLFTQFPEEDWEFLKLADRNHANSFLKNVEKKTGLNICLAANVTEIDPVGPNAGLENSVLNLAKALFLRGNNVSVIGKIKGEPINVHGIDFIPLDKVQLGYFTDYFNSLDVLCFSSGQDLGLYKYVPEKVKKILYFHHQDSSFMTGCNGIEFINKVCDAVICVSTNVKNNLAREGVRHEKLFVVPNGVDHNVFFPRDIQRDLQRIVYCGALVPDKGPDKLIEAFIAISKYVPAATLHLWGGASLWGKNEYINQIDVRTINQNIYFHGIANSEELALEYSKSAITVIPSNYESFSLVSVESQCCGCVPLASFTGGVPETMIPDVTGYLYNPNSISELSKSLLLLLQSPDLLNIASNRAKEFSNSFSWERSAIECEKIFSQLVGNTKRSSIAQKLTQLPVLINIAVKNVSKQCMLYSKSMYKTVPLVSVVIPCFNYGSLLKNAVESVLRQTSQDFEIIIVNDGSFDNSETVAKDLLENYSQYQICLINQENSGQPAISRNEGIKISRGKYILPLDADDEIAPSMLHECLKVLENNNYIGIAYTDAIFVSQENSRIHKSVEFSPAEIIYQNQFNYCSMYRKEVWSNVNGYKTNVKGYEDWDFWIACSERGIIAKHIPIPLFRYSVKSDGLFAKSVKNDKLLRANIVLNHSSLYEHQTVEYARRIISSSVENTPINNSENDFYRNKEINFFGEYSVTDKNLFESEFIFPKSTESNYRSCDLLESLQLKDEANIFFDMIAFSHNNTNPKDIDIYLTRKKYVNIIRSITKELRKSNMVERDNNYLSVSYLAMVLGLDLLCFNTIQQWEIAQPESIDCLLWKSFSFLVNNELDQAMNSFELFAKKGLSSPFISSQRDEIQRRLEKSKTALSNILCSDDLQKHIEDNEQLLDLDLMYQIKKELKNVQVERDSKELEDGLTNLLSYVETMFNIKNGTYYDKMFTNNHDKPYWSPTLIRNLRKANELLEKASDLMAQYSLTIDTTFSLLSHINIEGIDYK
jgi:glycosyltransferase involved in cell wall biosynthesis